MGAWRAWACLLMVVTILGLADRPAGAAAEPVISPATVLVTGVEMCSGTFISPSEVLTAKHCVEPRLGAPVGLSQPGSGWACTGRVAQLGVSDWTLVEGCVGRAFHSFRVLSAPPAGNPVRVVGYPYTLGARGQEEQTGRTLGGQRGELYLDLPLVAGYSGAGVIDTNDAKRPIIAVVSWRSAAPTSTIRSGAVMTNDAMLQTITAARPRIGAHRQVLPFLGQRAS